MQGVLFQKHPCIPKTLIKGICHRRIVPTTIKNDG